MLNKKMLYALLTLSTCYCMENSSSTMQWQQGGPICTRHIGTKESEFTGGAWYYPELDCTPYHKSGDQ